jgi:hypothetical protein
LAEAPGLSDRTKEDCASDSRKLWRERRDGIAGAAQPIQPRCFAGGAPACIALTMEFFG